MKLVLRYLMLHYFIRVLFVLTFRLASMALAYPLSVSNNTLQDSEGLVRRMNVQFSSVPAVPSTGHSQVYREVHPCRSSFLAGDTKLYKFEPRTLGECATLQADGRMAIAFLLWDSLGCGLVWPSMVLTKDEGTKVGTCFLGPQNATHPRKGLSPCQPGFEYSKSSFYDRLPQESRRSRHTQIPLADCRGYENAVAWRAVQEQPNKLCITLPSNEEHLEHTNDKPGHCFGYDPYQDKYNLWYLGQVVKKAYHSWKLNHTPNSDWVDHIPPELLLPE